MADQLLKFGIDIRAYANVHPTAIKFRYNFAEIHKHYEEYVFKQAPYDIVLFVPRGAYALRYKLSNESFEVHEFSSPDDLKQQAFIWGAKYVFTNDTMYLGTLRMLCRPYTKGCLDDARKRILREIEDSRKMKFRI